MNGPHQERSTRRAVLAMAAAAVTAGCGEMLPTSSTDGESGPAPLGDRWRTTVPRRPTGLSATDDAIVVTGADATAEQGGGYVLALDPSDGTERWRVDGLSHPVASARAPDGPLYVLAGGRELLRLDDGAVRWRESLDLPGRSSPARHGDVLAVRSGSVYVAGTDGTVLTVGADGEAKRLTVAAGGGETHLTATDDSLFVSSADTDASYLARFRRRDGERLWRYVRPDEDDRRMPVVLTSATVHDDRVAAGLVHGDTGLLLLDRATGDDTGADYLNGWTDSPVWAGDTGYIAHLTGASAFRPDGATRWTFSPENGRVEETPAVTDGAAFLLSTGGGKNHAFRLNAATGEPTHRFPIQAPEATGPVVAGDSAVLAAIEDDGARLVALERPA